MSSEHRMRRDLALTDEIQLVSVRIQGQLIGLPITSVRDVFSITSMTPVPKADQAVTGLVNLRGHIVTILDLGSLLNGKRSQLTSGQEPMAVGVEWHGEVFGLVVDEIGDVFSLAAKSSEPLPANMSASWAKFSRCVHKLETELMIEIDLQTLLESMTLQTA